MKKRVILRGPLLTQSGYGHHTRTILRALRTREDLFDVYLHALNWGATSWIWHDDEERKWIDQTLEKTIHYIRNGGQFDMSLQVSIPNEWQRIAPVNIGITAGIETTAVAPEWLDKASVVDKILTISSHSKKTFEGTVYKSKNEQTGEEAVLSCPTPVEYVSYPVVKKEPEKLNLDLSTKFNFLSVVQISPRKNLPQLISCFVESFKDNEDVGLILKVNIGKNSLLDRVNTESKLKMLLAPYEDIKCKIYLLHGYMTDEQMAGLYTHPNIKALVSTTHGEGFGLPIFEASYYGLPIAATDWSGHLDFLYKPTKKKNGKEKLKPMFKRISYTMGPIQKEVVWKGVLHENSNWAYPEPGSIKMAMDEIYKDHSRFKKQAKDLQSWVCEEFAAEKQYEKMVQLISPEEDRESWLQEIEEIVKEYE